MGIQKIQKLNLFKSSVLLNFIIIIVSFLVVIVILEITLRLFDPIGIEYFVEVRRYFASMQNNDNYAYIHRPGYTDVLQGVEVKINSHGFRGPEFNIKKSTNMTRILILGDSVVFGWGAPQSDIFALQLNNMLKKLRNNIEVIPVGVGSWNTRTEYEFLKVKGLQFEPNIVVHLITSNDIYPKKSGRTDISKEKLFKEKNLSSSEILSKIKRNVVNRSYFFSYIQYYLKRRLIFNKQIRANYSSPLWKDTEYALNGIVKLCQKRKITYIPFLYGTNKSINKNPIMKLYSDYFAKNDIEYIYMLNERIFDRQFSNTIVDSHPNSEGHTLIAKIIYTHLIPFL